LTDQLGSACVSYRADGGNVVGQRYEPRGEVKSYETNQLPSDYSFTGQEDVAFTRAPNFYDPVRLLDYGARSYWPAFGRFIAPDSIVPQPGNPQALNRHSYVLNDEV
jgi:RHS repeat-associated protein